MHFAQRTIATVMRDLLAVRALDRDYLHRVVDHRAFFLCYWTLVRDSGNRPGSPGAGQVSACCLLDRSNADQAQTMRTGLNTRPSRSGKHAASRLRRWSHTRAGPCPDRAQMPTASRKYYWAELREHVGISQIIKRRSGATHIFVKKKGSDPRCPQ